MWGASGVPWRACQRLFQRQDGWVEFMTGHEFAKISDTKDLHASMRENARKNAVNRLNVTRVSMDLRRDFAAIGIIEALGG